MTYKDLARTFEIIAKYANDDFVWDWAEHDEYGFSIEYPLLIEDIKELRNLGWLLGCDAEYNEDARLWDPETEEGKNATDEQLMELWDNYKGIYKYA